MKKNLIALLIFGFIQLVVSCVCESYYSVHRYEQLEMKVWANQIANDWGRDTVYAELTPTSNRADSIIQIILNLDSRHVEDVPLAHFHLGFSKAYASQPCDPEYEEYTDTIEDFDIIAVDTFNSILPGNSILRASGFGSYKKDSTIRAAFHQHFYVNIPAYTRHDSSHFHLQSWVSFTSGDTLKQSFIFP